MTHGDAVPAGIDASVATAARIYDYLPATGNVHQVAQAAAADSRVIYVDNDRCEPGCGHNGRLFRRAAQASPGSNPGMQLRHC